MSCVSGVKLRSLKTLVRHRAVHSDACALLRQGSDPKTAKRTRASRQRLDARVMQHSGPNTNQVVTTRSPSLREGSARHEQVPRTARSLTTPARQSPCARVVGTTPRRLAARACCHVENSNVVPPNRSLLQHRPHRIVWPLRGILRAAPCPAKPRSSARFRRQYRKSGKWGRLGGGAVSLMRTRLHLA